jgi:curved DNA-binding protein CbpA
MADPPELEEDVDLDLDRRRYVLDAYARLKQFSHYELLGVPRDANKKEVKRAYFRLAAVVHTDRYFGKKLGSYKNKMEALFTRISMAYETLIDADKRAAYDTKLDASGRTGGPAPVDPKIMAQRQAAMDALKQRFADAKAKAKQHADRAALARGAGDMAGAAEAYRVALTFAPNDPALTAALEDTQRAAADKVADSHVKQALLEERYGHWAEAAESWRRVAQARPDDAQAKERLANAIARASAGR